MLLRANFDILLPDAEILYCLYFFIQKRQSRLICGCLSAFNCHNKLRIRQRAPTQPSFSNKFEYSEEQHIMEWIDLYKYECQKHLNEMNFMCVLNFEINCLVKWVQKFCIFLLTHFLLYYFIWGKKLFLLTSKGSNCAGLNKALGSKNRRGSILRPVALLVVELKRCIALANS